MGQVAVKLVTYKQGETVSFGRLVDDGIVDGGRRLAGCASLREVLEAGQLGTLDDLTRGEAADVRLSDVDLLPVIPNPGKILCAGVNYRDHQQEAGASPEAEKPTIFIRVAESQIGAMQPVRIPAQVKMFDYEGEMALVIGRPGRNIAPESAYSHVAGYTCYNDFSARDWQGHSSQWTAGKNFEGTGAFGPFMATSDEVGDVSGLKLETRVNGQTRQSASVADMLFAIPDLIAYVSTWTPLAAGDVIVTGTPGGVGLFRNPRVFLSPGDVVEVEITGLGVLRSDITA